MNNPTVWWLLTGALVGVELLTGTVYLLMLAIGTAAAALAAHAQASVPTQMVVAALLGFAAVSAWHLLRTRRTGPLANADRNVLLDVGEQVHVVAWQEGHARVQYRGAQWAAILEQGAVAQPGAHRIVEVQGSCLVLAPL